jgi:3-oxoacid CoA-transferase subunit A
MPSCETKTLVENKLLEHQDRIYGFLTHTCPISVIPREMFVSTKRAAKEEKHSTKKHNEEYPLDIDRSTEEWLQTLMDRVGFEEWYCGHYHVEKDIGKIHMLHKQIVPFESTDTKSEKGG